MSGPQSQATSSSAADELDPKRMPELHIEESGSEDDDEESDDDEEDEKTKHKKLAEKKARKERSKSRRRWNDFVHSLEIMTGSE